MPLYMASVARCCAGPADGRARLAAQPRADTLYVCVCSGTGVRVSPRGGAPAGKGPCRCPCRSRAVSKPDNSTTRPPCMRCYSALPCRPRQAWRILGIPASTSVNQIVAVARSVCWRQRPHICHTPVQSPDRGTRRIHQNARLLPITIPIEGHGRQNTPASGAHGKERGRTADCVTLKSPIAMHGMKANNEPGTLFTSASNTWRHASR